MKGEEDFAHDFVDALAISGDVQRCFGIIIVAVIENFRKAGARILRLQERAVHSVAHACKPLWKTLAARRLTSSRTPTKRLRRLGEPSHQHPSFRSPLMRRLSQQLSSFLSVHSRLRSALADRMHA